ncbi:MAG: hypothetical protein CMN10_04850 [Roseobacter sp.]|jgi:uncharacterized NAD(P)/FAD-binding protein YdhS|nr:hypothetical protein [Roseobacter sp.]MBV47878.1 hypothetical protein [Roseobacter sp.]
MFHPLRFLLCVRATNSVLRRSTLSSSGAHRVKNIAIIGGGPTAVYTLAALIASKTPIGVVIFEKCSEIGSGMPYSSDTATPSMMSNIAGFEIPPVITPLRDWLADLDRKSLADMRLSAEEIDAKTYYGRLVLGRYFQAQLSQMVSRARGAGHQIELRRRTKVTDVLIKRNGISVFWASPLDKGDDLFDEVVIATGHSWTRLPKDEATDTNLIPLWPIKDVHAIAGDYIGVLGTSLSGIDAVVAIADLHGDFIEGKNGMRWALRAGHSLPRIAMLSRKGLLPEADYYYPFPLPELNTLTEDRVLEESQHGQTGLFDRLFSLFIKDLRAVVGKDGPVLRDDMSVDDFVDTYFSTRMATDPFEYARSNLAEARAGHANRTPCPWRISILKAHEVFEMAAPYLNEADLEVLKSKLGSVFADNYSSVPHPSIERMLALHDIGVLEVIALGNHYDVENTSSGVKISNGKFCHSFDALIDARGQRPLGINELGFAGLVIDKTVKEMGQGAGVHLTPLVPTTGYIQCVALPILLARRPFVQGLASCAKLGAGAGQSILERVNNG